MRISRDVRRWNVDIYLRGASYNDSPGAMR
jgi:hypothetical protein